MVTLHLQTDAPELYPNPTGKEKRLHLGPESCGGRCEAFIEA